MTVTPALPSDFRLPEALTDACRMVLESPDAKVSLTMALAAAWREGKLSLTREVLAVDRPHRPEKPELMAPGRMPKRRAGGNNSNRIALLHALAHIELNAIDLAWDIIARFGPCFPERQFFDDWVQVAEDEARHFQLLEDRLAILGSHYGALPAHDGLWQAAQETADDPMARLALVPMLLEARALDVTPATVERMRRSGDEATAEILQQICCEEEDHVRAGTRWFHYLAQQRDIDPVATWHDLVKSRFKGEVKPPFNHAARERAGMARAFYEGLTKLEENTTIPG